MRTINEITAQLWRGVEARASVAALLYAGTLCAASLTAVAVWEKTPLGPALGPMLGELVAAMPLPGAPVVRVGPGAPPVRLAPPVAQGGALGPVAAVTLEAPEPAVVTVEPVTAGTPETVAESVPEEQPEAEAPGGGVEVAEAGTSTAPAERGGESGGPEPRVTEAPTAPATPAPQTPREPPPVPTTAPRPEPAARNEAAGDAGGSGSPQSGVAGAVEVLEGQRARNLVKRPVAPAGETETLAKVAQGLGDEEEDEDGTAGKVKRPAKKPFERPVHARSLEKKDETHGDGEAAKKAAPTRDEMETLATGNGEKREAAREAEEWRKEAPSEMSALSAERGRDVGAAPKAPADREEKRPAADTRNDTKAETPREDPAKSETAKSEPVKAEQVKREPAGPEAAKAARVEPAKAEPAKAEVAKPETGKAEAAKAETDGKKEEARVPGALAAPGGKR